MSLLDSLICYMPLVSNDGLAIGTGVATTTRATTGTYVDRNDGLIKTAAINAARFEAQGRLIEGASTNLLLRSEEFDNAAWGKASSAAVTANQAIAPDGNLTADLIDLTADTNARVFQTLSSQAIATYTYSVYLKAKPGESGTFPIRLVADSTVDLLADIDDSSWKRFSITASRTTIGNVIPYAGNVQVSGETLEEAFIWGAQLEALPLASSYIPTTTTSVTRAADNLSIDAANIPAPTADYSVSASVSILGKDSSAARVINVEGEINRDLRIDGSRFVLFRNAGNVSTSTSSITVSTSVNLVAAVDSTNQTLFFDGAQEDQDVKGTVTGTATSISIGKNSSANFLFGHIKDLRIYDIALTAEQVQENLTWSLSSPRLTGPLTFPLTKDLEGTLTGS